MKKVVDNIKSFIRHCQYEKNLSEKTLKAYTIDLTQFQNFVESQNIDSQIEIVPKEIIKDYIQSISSFKSKTLKRKIAVLKAMFSYLEYEEIININPFRKLKIKIKEEKLIPKALSLDEIEKIISAAYFERDIKFGYESQTNKEIIRDICLLELLFTTGGRISEIINITINQIDLKTGFIIIKGKGNKERKLQIFNNQVLRVLKTYRDLRSDTKKTEHFFINRNGAKLSDQSARGIVRKYAKKANLSKRVTPHMFRHSFATLLLENDVDIKYIQHFLGHSSIATTQIYTQVNSFKTLSLLENKHPRSKSKF